MSEQLAEAINRGMFLNSIRQVQESVTLKVDRDSVTTTPTEGEEAEDGIAMAIVQGLLAMQHASHLDFWLCVHSLLYEVARAQAARDSQSFKWLIAEVPEISGIMERLRKQDRLSP